MNIILTDGEMRVLQKLFQHPAGVEAKLLIEQKFCNVSGFDVDPYVHAFNSGRRGLALLMCACAEKVDEVVGTDHIDSLDNDNLTN